MSLDPGPANIEADFIEAMRPIGAVRPVELDPGCECESNADILFVADGVIAEIKTLLDDPRERKSFDDAIAAMFARWVRQGLVGPAWGQVQLRTDLLPYECGREVVRYITRRVKTDVRDANRQIKRTKTSLNMPDASGLLVLCNSGCPTLTPHVMLWALNDALRDDNSAVRWVIYLTAGLPVRTSASLSPTEVWIDGIRRGGDPLPSEFAERMRGAWFAHLARRGPVSVLLPPNNDSLFSAVHITDPRTAATSPDASWTCFPLRPAAPAP